MKNTRKIENDSKKVDRRSVLKSFVGIPALSLFASELFNTASMVPANDVSVDGPEARFIEWQKMNAAKDASYKIYNDAKFGMFIHWGPYSTLGGIWKDKKIPGLGEWIMYHAQIPRDEYRAVCKTFNPTDFDAETWVKLAKDAGMKYIVAMTKHHDGFAMYHSKVSDYNIYDMTPFKRDPIEELYNACQKYDIKLGLYYSHSFDWMDGGDAGIADEVASKTGRGDKTNKYGANLWDPAETTFLEYIESKAKPQMREILKKFPDLIEIWYDFPRFMLEKQSFEFYKLAYEIQPNCLINSRVGNEFGDFKVAGDNQIPTTVDPKYRTWETPGTLNNTWGYKSYDNDWKTIDEMLYWIAEIASKGGNYLLNIGPTGKGIVPDESVVLLKEIGKWMKVNGEAIYGTQKWDVLREGPSTMEIKSTTEREKQGFNLTFTTEDFWFTRKDNNVYVISLTKPDADKVRVKSLFRCHKQIKKIYLLGRKKSLKWDVEDDAIKVRVPAQDTGELVGFVLKVKLK